MIEIRLDMAKQRIPTMTDEEIAAACGEVMRLQNFDILDVVNPDDVSELFGMLGVEVERRNLVGSKDWLRRRRTDR